MVQYSTVLYCKSTDYAALLISTTPSIFQLYSLSDSEIDITSPVSKFIYLELRY
jgi:hypothetical protein